MARFFRALFSLVLVLYLIIMLALFIPPLVGVSTVTATYNTEGNQAVGTVDYSVRKPLSAITAGDKILVSDSSSVNVYTVQSTDTANSTVMINTGSGMQELTVKSYVQKLLAAVPIIGFITIILQSPAGFLVLGLTAVLLILLVILMSIRCRKDKARRKKQAMSRKERKQKESMERYSREPQEDRPVLDSTNGYRSSGSNTKNTRTAADNISLDRTTVLGETHIQEKVPELDEEYEDFPPKETADAAQVKKNAVQQESKPEITKTILPVMTDVPTLTVDEEKELSDEMNKSAGISAVPISEEDTETDQIPETGTVQTAEESIAHSGKDEQTGVTETYNPEAEFVPDDDDEEDTDQFDDDMSELAVSDMILASVQETDIYDIADVPETVEQKNGLLSDESNAEESGETPVQPVVNQNTDEADVDTEAVSEAVRGAVQDIVVDKVVEVEKSSTEGGDGSSPQQIMLTINIKVV